MAGVNVEGSKSRAVDEIRWKAEGLEVAERPNGPAAAAILAAGIGSLVLGILTTMAEANTGLRGWLQFQDRVGPLSGKVIVSMIAYVISWAVLVPLLWRRNLPFSLMALATALLLTGGFIGTFPKFFQLFAPD